MVKSRYQRIFLELPTRSAQYAVADGEFLRHEGLLWGEVMYARTVETVGISFTYMVCKTALCLERGCVAQSENSWKRQCEHIGLKHGVETSRHKICTPHTLGYAGATKKLHNGCLLHCTGCITCRKCYSCRPQAPAILALLCPGRRYRAIPYDNGNPHSKALPRSISDRSP